MRGVRSSPVLVARLGMAGRVPPSRARARGRREGRRTWRKTICVIIANPMAATETMTPAPSATPVEGSGGLLLNIDGKIVPNYAATMVSFDEGDVVNG